MCVDDNWKLTASISPPLLMCWSIAFNKNKTTWLQMMLQDLMMSSFLSKESIEVWRLFSGAFIEKCTVAIWCICSKRVVRKYVYGNLKIFWRKMAIQPVESILCGLHPHRIHLLNLPWFLKTWKVADNAFVVALLLGWRQIWPRIYFAVLNGLGKG